MSRDFTPRENYYVNKNSNNSFLSNIYWVFNGVEKPLWTEEEQKIRHKYPSLAVTFCDRFIQLYNSFPNNKKDIYTDKIEKMLNILIKADEENYIYQAEVPKEMIDWYLGKLDPGFYYREYNNELFYQFLKEYEKEGKLL